MVFQFFVFNLMPYLPSVRIALVFMSALLLVKSFLEHRRTHRNLPPGPWGLPLLGATFRLGVNPARSLEEISREYGKIFSLRIGPRLTVVMADTELVKEAFGKKAEATSARENFRLDWMDTSGALVSCSGSDVKPLRRFLLSSLRDFGLGKKGSELLIQDEAQHLCQGFGAMDRESFDPSDLIQMAVANVICSLCFGTRFPYDSPEMAKLITGLREASHIGAFSLTRDIPLLFLAPSFKSFRDGVLVYRSMMEDILRSHVKTFDPGNPRDVVDKLLRVIAGNDSPFSFGADRVYRTMMDMFGASVDTTASSLQFAVLHMALNPEVQKKVRDEILQKIGNDRAPGMTDRDTLPYTSAVINEVLRISHPVPLSIPHRATKTFELGGYTIPAGTDLVSLICAQNRDPKTFDNPEEFQPERFLSEDGQTVVLPNTFLPFGAGSRMCIGEGLARYELFLFFTAMMQRFTFDISPEARKTHKALFGYFLWYPSSVQIRATPNF
ncbi:cytochrome P450 2J3-like [Asterias rubens]|uniref:cytochrome P450 2J3-like n=1 Tax=Asterias rubens TaxID=7604 RepID=UPI0014555CC0|nr:cytochrome P450 2J3-like [Asterias rubens]